MNAYNSDTSNFNDIPTTTAAQQSLQLTLAQKSQLLSIPLLLGNPQHLLGNPQLLGNQSLFQPRTNGHQ